jgi:hypothetical protein
MAEGLLLIKVWRQLNGIRPAFRRPIKCAVFLFVLVATLFPNPWRLSTHLGRISRVEDLVDGNAPELAPLQQALDPAWAAAETPAEQLLAVQNFVYEYLEYEWDWNTWGVLDYWPTVAEIIERGKEDCDGQAILGASLLRGRGIDTRMAANIYHMWVVTDHGETMLPDTSKLLESTDQGIRLDLSGVGNMRIDLAFGLAVFPLVRELILLATFWLLWLSPRGNWVLGIGSGAVLWMALMILRGAAGPLPYLQETGPYWTGLTIAAMGLAMLVWSGRPKRSAVMSPVEFSPEPVAE